MPCFEDVFDEGLEDEAGDGVDVPFFDVETAT